MAKKVILKDGDGNQLHPETKTESVISPSGWLTEDMIKTAHGVAQSAVFDTCTSLPAWALTLEEFDFDLPEATSMLDSFNSDTKLKKVSITAENCTTMQGAFYNCSNLKECVIDAPNVTTFRDAFRGCVSMQTLDLTACTRATMFKDAFRAADNVRGSGCAGTIKLPNCKASLNCAFYYNSKVTAVEFDTIYATDIGSFFLSCSSIKSISGILDLTSCSNVKKKSLFIIRF